MFLALFGFAFFQPEIAATVARLVLALLGLTGFFLILLLALRGYDRAVLLVPTWIIYIAWLFYAWLVVTGQVSNDVAQPAVAGGLVLIVMLLGFTSVQHAFSEGQVSIGTLSRSRAPRAGADRLGRLRLRLEHRARPRLGLR